jgi:hypothetical protein
VHGEDDLAGVRAAQCDLLGGTHGPAAVDGRRWRVAGSIEGRGGGLGGGRCAAGGSAGRSAGWGLVRGPPQAEGTWRVRLAEANFRRVRVPKGT